MDTTEAPNLIADIPVLDIKTLTFGEMAEVEAQSGRSFNSLLRGAATGKLLALWVHEYRNSEKPRSWQELSDLRAFAPRS
jgi:hypothetical protein